MSCWKKTQQLAVKSNGRCVSTAQQNWQNLLKLASVQEMVRGMVQGRLVRVVGLFPVGVLTGAQKGLEGTQIGIIIAFLYLNVYRGDPNKKVCHYNMACQNVITITLQHISPCFAMNFIRIPSQNNR